MKRVQLLAAVAVVVIVGVSAVTTVRRNRSEAPLRIASSAPRFSSLEAMVIASDEIVVAEVTDVTAGRSLRDATNPSASIRTNLAHLHIVQVLKGAPPEPVLVEQEVALASGRAIRVDGVRPVTAGQRGVFFLVRSAEPGVAYRAVLGAQGRFLVAGDELEAATDDALSRRIEAAGGPALVRAVRAVASSR